MPGLGNVSFMHTSNQDHNTSSPALVHLHQAEVRRQGRIVLSNICFTLHKGQNIMVVGPNGAGKSTFLALLRGDIWPVSKNGISPRQFRVKGKWQDSPLGWKESTALISPEFDHRYRRLEALSCAQVIASGLCNELRPLSALSHEQQFRLQDLARKFGLLNLLSRPFSALSQGESQKALIARAMIGRPHLLFWDEVGTGLDAQSRDQVLDLLHTLIQQGVQVIASTHRPHDLADCLEQTIALEQGHICLPGSVPGQKPVPTPRESSEDPSGLNRSSKLSIQRSICHEKSNLRISLDQVAIGYHGQKVLGPMSLTIRADEHWLIHGPNGSGKTTLLRLIAGEIHPSRGQCLRYPPLNSATLQGLRHKYGYFSPELTIAHRRSQTGLHAVLSGLRGQIGPRDTFTSAERQQALDWMKTMNIQDLAHQDILSLSSGQLRRVLLARALVHSPYLLLLDEPCAGLDDHSRHDFLFLLDSLARSGIQMIMVAHRKEETPVAINRRASLNKGHLDLED